MPGLPGGAAGTWISSRWCGEGARAPRIHPAWVLPLGIDGLPGKMQGDAPVKHGGMATLRPRAAGSALGCVAAPAASGLRLSGGHQTDRNTPGAPTSLLQPFLSPCPSRLVVFTLSSCSPDISHNLGTLETKGKEKKAVGGSILSSTFTSSLASERRKQLEVFAPRCCAGRLLSEGWGETFPAPTAPCQPTGSQAATCGLESHSLEHPWPGFSLNEGCFDPKKNSVPRPKPPLKHQAYTRVQLVL